MSNPRKNNISDNEQLSLDFGYFDIVPPPKKMLLCHACKFGIR